jgi:hypothetical protein
MRGLASTTSVASHSITMSCLAIKRSIRMPGSSFEPQVPEGLFAMDVRGD